MIKSSKSVISPARINITLNVESSKAPENLELPMKLLFLGEFEQSNTALPLRERPRYRVDGARLDACLQKLSPTVKLTVSAPLVGSDKEQAVELRFQSLRDFHPDNIAERVPALRQWLVMRNLLKDLKACVMDKPSFRRALNDILKNKEQLEQLTQKLRKLAPLSTSGDLS